MSGLIRYPGGKSRLMQKLAPLIPQQACTYIEPFLGAGGSALWAIQRLRPLHVLLNDADPDIVALWKFSGERDLHQLISTYTPTVDSFYEFKQLDFSAQHDDPVQRAFRLIVLHQLSFSGLGKMAGSPIGGKSQRGTYKVGCRWNADRIIGKLKQACEILSRQQVSFYNRDAIEFLEDCGGGMLYVDPPYFRQGAGLYSNTLNHEALAKALRLRDAPWLLSYDDCPEIRTLYNWANIHEIHTRYSMVNDPASKIELGITP